MLPLHERLVSELVAEDKRLAKRERHPNIYRCAHFLRALNDAEAHPQGLAAGLSECFTHSRLRDKLRKAAGLPVCACARQGACPLCR